MSVNGENVNFHNVFDSSQSKESPLSIIIERAKVSAAKHGINLIEGRKNPATGDCAFEASIFNVNDRSCFGEQFFNSIEDYRKLWISEVESLLFEGPFNPGYSKSEWKAGFDKLKQRNVYDIEFFGDMVIPIIACGIKKILLIFNTNLDHPRDPVTVVDPKKFGIEPSCHIPVVLAYNLVHYESLHPVSREDDEKCVQLVNRISTGNYEFTYKDLSNLVDFESVKREDDKSNNNDPNEFKSSKQVPLKTVREMNVDEKRKYHRDRYHARKASLNKDGLLQTQNNWRKDKSSIRSQKRKHNVISFNAARATEKNNERIKKRTQDEACFKIKRANEKKNERIKKRTQDEAKFKTKRANEKKDERKKKHTQNEHSFKVKMAAEKKNERTKKRAQDENSFTVKRANEKRIERTKKMAENPELFKQKQKEEKRKTIQIKNSSEEGRRTSFRNSIREGRKYSCICCHRLFFNNGVVKFSSDFEEEVSSNFKDIILKSIGKIQTTNGRGTSFICITCKNHISKGKVPPMSNQNNLQLFDLNPYEELQLTELENSMIALNILFQKIFKLPKSRWPAMKDKTINIPVYETDILNTIKSLPRTPKNAGIIPIDLKRKMNFKNSHMTQYVSVPKILKALETLQHLGNPYYQFMSINDNFKDELREIDLEGFQFIYPEDELFSEDVVSFLKKTHDKNTDKHKQNTKINAMEDQMEDIDKEEAYYQDTDPVKKWQFQYNRSTCFNHDYPEIDYKEDNLERVTIAPGEGKYPTNILKEKDWDLKAFPALLPDGKNSLHAERKVKLSEQDYFVQRIMNKDLRFACNPAYCFAAVSYIENKQIEGRKGISFKRGRCSTSIDGTSMYTLEDPVSVLDNIKNTPRYWQKTRYELIARLENLGAFSHFFTLSCADMRYPENFTPFLQNETIYYEDFNGQERVFIGDEREPLMDFLERKITKHEFIRKNLLNATLTFHHRVKIFLKHIIMNKGSPLRIKYYSYKVEFALRGAPHIHGVLWMDWDNFTALESNKVKLLVKAFEKIKDDVNLDKSDKDVLAEFADLSISCSLKDHKTKKIVEEVQMHNHTRACRKHSTNCRFSFPRYPSLHTIISVPFNKLQGNEKEQKQAFEKSKVVLNKVAAILDDKDLLDILTMEDKDSIDRYVRIQHSLSLVDQILKTNKERKNIQVDICPETITIIKEFSKYSNMTGTILVEDLKNIYLELKRLEEMIDIKEIEQRRLENLLAAAGIQRENEKSAVEVYEEALGVSKHGYKIVHKRDIDECYVNNYNPEWLISWNSNMDLQLCLDYHAVITYISDYYSKDDSGTMPQILEALKHSENQSLQSRLSVVANTFLTHRQIGESEAFFKILPHLQMKHSNIDAVFLPTGFKENRSRFLMELTEDQAKQCQNVLRIQNKEGLFTEKPSLIDKYERIDTSRNMHLLKLTYIQFAMKYTSSNVSVEDSEFLSKIVKQNEDDWELTDEMNLIVDHDFQIQTERYTLPKYIKLEPKRIGEPQYMRRRSRQVIRFHKINPNKYPHEYFYSQLQLYSPFRAEKELEPENLQKCKELFDKKSSHNNEKKIENVKSILMKHLDSVVEGTERAKDTMNSEVEDMIDPAFAQDQDDCEMEGFIEYSEFSHKDPSNLEVCTEPKQSFRSIELYDMSTLDNLIKNLDDDQRIVLDLGVQFAKTVVKNKYASGLTAHPELIVVQGGAGTGKSMVIDVLSQQMEYIFRSPGDNPDHPYIIKAAFTGTAAANIKGQTLHSAFSFSFGNEFYTLSDKSREERRSQLENLHVVIIDEFSFIKADMLYLLDLRLKELKQVTDVPFGGVSVFLFGDILQLRPVCAAYIFEEPYSEKFKLAFHVKSLWKQFKVILLRTNHRQGEDRSYADILNRIRCGDILNEDIQALAERVRPLNHPEIPQDALFITCTNKEVNRINKERLELIGEKEYQFDSINKGYGKKDFNPKIDASGAVTGTPLQKTIRLKIGAKVMLTYNLDTCDSLTNGASGEVVGFDCDTNGKIKEVHVKFYNSDCGKNERKRRLDLQNRYPGKNVIGIKPIEFQYSLSKKKSDGLSNASIIQLPLRLAFASTAHKVQGFTIKKPNLLVVDLRNVKEPAQAYVILSRVQALSQLFIIESVCEEKIIASKSAMDELNRMEKVASNMQVLEKNLIVSCNIRSIKKNLSHILASSFSKRAQVICLQETWLDSNVPTDLMMNGWKQHNNSVGKGKGVSTLYQEPYYWINDVTNHSYQLTKISSGELDLINVYRSSDASTVSFIEDLFSLITCPNTLIVGDFNLCFKSENKHKIFQFLKDFKQLVKNPTHNLGRMIDLAFISGNFLFQTEQHSTFFTDHDILALSSGKLGFEICTINHVITDKGTDDRSIED